MGISAYHYHLGSQKKSEPESLTADPHRSEGLLYRSIKLLGGIFRFYAIKSNSWVLLENCGGPLCVSTHTHTYRYVYTSFSTSFFFLYCSLLIHNINASALLVTRKNILYFTKQPYHTVNLGFASLGKINDVHSVVVEVLQAAVKVPPEKGPGLSWERDSTKAEL